ncbi:MAG TPA: AMP-binding protein, partial [Vicinamibacterales bacterium]|nr:AMP-binding protein [Vicinamibacterales bacterium]
ALRLTGCGYPVTDTDLRIVDPREGVALPRGRVGEGWVAGPQVARGYWRSAGGDVFNAVLSERGTGPFLRTGDLGFLSEDGELVFVDRLKDLMIVNGQNYVCHDLELTVGTSHPLLSPESCIACGMDGGDQTRIAVIAEWPSDQVAHAGEAAQAIRSALFTRHGLAAHTVAFVAPRRLSRTTSGKLQRRVNARRLAAGDLRVLAQYGDPLPSHASTSLTLNTQS